MKFKFTIQPYQTEAVESVVNIFAGQPFNNRWTYRRDVSAVKESAKAEDEAIERNLENWRLTDEELKEKKRQEELARQREQEELAIGFANAKVQLDKTQLLENIRRMQARNNIKLSDKLTSSLGACSLDVEMETGTGKTYVYIKTMFELNKRYGWSKFIVVVPSVAIREGIRKSFASMQEHFMEHYRKKPGSLYTIPRIWRRLTISAKVQISVS